MPSVDSRTMTRSIVLARSSASAGGTPGMARIGPDAGIEPEGDAQIELRRDLGAVGEADVGPAHGAEQDRVGLAGARDAILGQDRAGLR